MRSVFFARKMHALYTPLGIILLLIYTYSYISILLLKKNIGLRKEIESIDIKR